MERKTVNILGFDVDIISFEDAVRYLTSRIQNKEGTHVVTINPEIIESAQKDENLSHIIRNAELVVADGAGIKAAIKLKGIEQQKIPGIDLAAEMFKHANSFGFRVALIGAKQEVLELAEKNIKNRFIDLDICYRHNGYFDTEKKYEIINELNNSKPDFVLVALGSPKQEFFINKCREIIPNATYIGIGGSFDVWSGIVERAPEFFRVMDCEWIYRTLKQPERLKRIYKTLPLFAIKAIIDALKFRINNLKRGNNG